MSFQISKNALLDGDSVVLEFQELYFKWRLMAKHLIVRLTEWGFYITLQ